MTAMRTAQPTEFETIDAQVSPTGVMEVLSSTEVAGLLERGHGGLFELFRSCSLAVLGCGSDIDD